MTRMKILPPPPEYPLPPPAPALAVESTAPPSAANPDARRGRRGGCRFEKGNPGRRLGSRNRTTLAVESIFQGEAESIARVALLLASRGDMTAIREILGRVVPPRKSRPIELEGFPKIESVQDVPKAMSFLANATARGEISADEAAGLASVVNQYTAAVEAVDHETRLAAIEKAQAEARGL